MTLRRKKWSELEELTLIDKYAEMLADGTLSRLKTREKRFRPIANHVNLMHHLRDPIAFPWQWTWKDVSTKVQNMRHQYVGVKQKIKKNVVNPNHVGQEEYDWVEGLTHWPNFLRYKDVFGDVIPGIDDSDDRENRNYDGFDDRIRGLENLQIDGLGSSLDDGLLHNGVTGSGLLGLGLGLEYDNSNGDGGSLSKNDGEAIEFEDSEAEELRKKRKRSNKSGECGRMAEQRLWEFLLNQIAQLRDRELQVAERERERKRREEFRTELEEEREGHSDESERQSQGKIFAMANESAEREKKRDENIVRERDWVERMEKRRLEWKKGMDDMMRRHRAEMVQLHARILQDQQNMTNQLLGILSQWTTGHSTGLPDHTGAGNPYLSQMIQNLHHVNGIVPGENRIVADNHDDQFIVDS